jgi:hypothetical protein
VLKSPSPFYKNLGVGPSVIWANWGKKSPRKRKMATQAAWIQGNHLGIGNLRKLEKSTAKLLAEYVI